MLVFTLFFIVAFAATGVTYGRYILWPMIEPGRDPGNDRRLYTVDFFSMTVLLAIPLAIARVITEFDSNPLMPERKYTVFAILSVFMAPIFLWAWFRGATKMSSLGIRHGLKRFVFLSLVTPVVVFGTGVGCPFCCVFALNIFEPRTGLIAWWIAAVFVIFLSARFGRMTTEWVASQDVQDA